MTVKEAKEYLGSLGRLNSSIDQKIAELGELRAMMGAVKSLDYAKEHVQTSPAGEAPYIADVERWIRLDEEINQEIDRYVDEKHRIINGIQQVKNHAMEQLLYKHYVEFKNFTRVAEEMNYAYRYVLFLHGRALKEFADVITALPGADG